MSSREHRFALVAAVALQAVSCAKPAGLQVDVDLGAFRDTTQTLKLTLTATGGFQKLGLMQADFVNFETQDVDGDGAFELIVTLSAPFKSAKRSFLVDTNNHVLLTVQGEAKAFDDTKLIAGAAGNATVPGGGSGTLTFTLSARQPGSEGPKTRNTDLLTDPANVVVKGPAINAHASTVAACALDGDGVRNDLVVGVPLLDRDSARMATGAVFVVFDADMKPDVKLDPTDGSQLVLFGAESGDQMGAAVACADLDGDGFDDVIAGAPMAANQVGRVYAVLGRQALNSHPVDLDPAVTKFPADVVWGPSGARPAGAVGNGFGNTLFAFNLKGNAKANVLVSEPERKRVHLVQAPNKASALVDVDLADHPVLTGVSATSLTAGDFDGTTTGIDIAVGDPSFVPSGLVASKGAVLLFANVDVGATIPTDITAAQTTMVGDGGGYGTTVLALDTTGRGQDLLVGAPSGGDGRGLVYWYEHSNGFFLASLRDFTATAKARLDLAEPNAGFGSSLGACRGGSKTLPTWTLVVGAPNVQHGTMREHVGAAYLLGGGGTFSVVEHLYGVATQDRLGSAVTCADLDGDTNGDLVTVAPSAMGVGAGSGVVYGLKTHK
jgi:hypothetical protein